MRYRSTTSGSATSVITQKRRIGGEGEVCVYVYVCVHPYVGRIHNYTVEGRSTTITPWQKVKRSLTVYSTIQSKVSVGQRDDFIKTRHERNSSRIGSGKKTSPKVYVRVGYGIVVYNRDRLTNESNVKVDRLSISKGNVLNPRDNYETSTEINIESFIYSSISEDPLVENVKSYGTLN